MFSLLRSGPEGIWLLALTVLPRVMRERSPSKLLDFESAYERIGIPALLVQVATGLWLAHRLVPEISRWLAFDDPVARLVGVKVLLLCDHGGFRPRREAATHSAPFGAESALARLAHHPGHSRFGGVRGRRRRLSDRLVLLTPHPSRDRRRASSSATVEKGFWRKTSSLDLANPRPATSAL